MALARQGMNLQFCPNWPAIPLSSLLSVPPAFRAPTSLRCCDVSGRAFLGTMVRGRYRLLVNRSMIRACLIRAPEFRSRGIIYECKADFMIMKSAAALVIRSAIHHQDHSGW